MIHCLHRHGRPHALALSLLAGVLGETSSTLEARTKVEEALRLSRDLEDPWTSSWMGRQSIFK